MKKFSFFNFFGKARSRFAKQFTTDSGFTLIELLTAIGILSVIGTIAVTVITVTLRGTRKTDLLEFARQNGSAALSQMVKSIRFAESLDNPATCVPTQTVSSITITSLIDHAQTTYSCAGNTIASNSASLLDANSIKTSACSFVCVQPTANDPPTITIQFTLSPKNPGGFVETNFTLPFQSSVTLRNY
ncbi:MAG TPA: type II secretion system protein [Candidatus Acidoferrales bacterium]|nr:type II secretion system protein [Candidatus Acidoferrales bacterium]